MSSKLNRYLMTLLGLGFIFGGSLYAQEGEAPTIDPTNTAFMIVCCALVLLMTPGLALFYGGLVRSKNVLSTMMHSFFCMGLCSVVWFACAGSIAFGPSVGGFFGNPTEYAFLSGVSHGDVWPDCDFPFFVGFGFQMMFAIITPALISGAFAERIKFSAFCVFTTLWLILVYAPICHWVWGGGILSGDEELSWMMKWFNAKPIDFAGGTVVHISSGVSALVFCLVLGKRKGYPGDPMPPHNLPMCALGAGLLWFGWFGFNAGSELAADDVAGNAFIVTHICAAVAAFTWGIIEWIHCGKASLLGVVTGLVAGLVCITPACGNVYPGAAFIMGIVVAVVCYICVAIVKEKVGYDDSLDVFGVHSMGGTVGALLAGVLCHSNLGVEAGGSQFMSQFASVVITWVYAGVMSFIFLKVIGATIGLRPNEDDEATGMDLSQHGEKGYQS